jgi:NAD(P)-dependent dehydrogenase (short-subunit alcohol dehydrogenase family)
MTAKTVLITGASRGIGLTFVKHYVASGWKVIAAARNVDAADNLRALAPHTIVQLDVADEQSITRAAEQLKDEIIDLLINNAGVNCRESLDSAQKAGLMMQMEVNAVGPFLVTRAFRENLKRAAAASGVAKVANLSSRMGSIALNKSDGIYGVSLPPLPIQYGYMASKAALNMINKSLAIDLKSDGIVALVITPGFVATDMNDHSGVLSADVSVEGMARVIDKATIEQTGRFCDYADASLPW